MMKDRIWAAYFHGISTDENPQHDKCSDKWCFYRQKKNGNHASMLKIKICPEIADKVRAVYMRLTRDELLLGCVNGLTQNANECFHSVVWSIFPKVTIYLFECTHKYY